MKKRDKGGEISGPWKVLENGRWIFPTAADYYRTLMDLGVCPRCGGKLEKYQDGSSKYLCTNPLHLVTWTEQKYFDKVILDTQKCPTCNSKLIRFGARPRDKQRFRCQIEKKVWTVKTPAYGDAWAAELGLPFNSLMEIVILWQLGWAKNRIHRKMKGRKNSILRALDGLTAGLIDVASEAQPQVIYYCLWDYLLREKKSGHLPVKLPRLDDPWELKSDFDKFLQEMRLLQADRDKKLAARAVFGALRNLLMTVARGRFGKRQLECYGSQAQHHLLSLATRFPKSTSLRQSVPKSVCYWCQSLPVSGHSLEAVVERTLHRNGLCREVKNVFDGLAGMANIAELLVDDPSKEIDEDLRSLAGDDDLDTILSRHAGANRSTIIQQGYGAFQARSRRAPRLPRSRR